MCADFSAEGCRSLKGRLYHIEEHMQKACCTQCDRVASVECGMALPPNLPLRCQRAAKTAARHLHVAVLTCHGVHQNPGFCSRSPQRSLPSDSLTLRKR